MEYDLTLFEKGLEELGIALSQEQKKQFITYYEYLVEKNKVMNLTAITEYNEVILKHFLDSLSIVKVGSFDQKKLTGKSVIDIGPARWRCHPKSKCPACPPAHGRW